MVNYSFNLISDVPALCLILSLSFTSPFFLSSSFLSLSFTIMVAYSSILTSNIAALGTLERRERRMNRVVIGQFSILSLFPFLSLSVCHSLSQSWSLTLSIQSVMFLLSVSLNLCLFTSPFFPSSFVPCLFLLHSWPLTHPF